MWISDEIVLDPWDDWGLYRYTYYGRLKFYEELFEGTETECRKYALINYTAEELDNICVMNHKGREWKV